MSINKFYPNPEQLDKGLKHIFWEIKQLIDSTTAELTPESEKFKFFILESSLIHVRVLTDFFEKRARSRKSNTEQDDMLCMDFGFEPKKISIPDSVFSRLNKDLAHLTYSRILQTEETGKWNIFHCHIPVLERCTNFIPFIIEKSNNNQQLNEISQWDQLNNRIVQFLNWANQNKGQLHG